MGDRQNRRILGIPDEFWIGFVITIGFFLKFVYNVKVGYRFSPHEIGAWTEIVNGVPNGGHIGVIQYYFQFHKLPDFNPMLVNGMANPPLFYIASAFYMWIFHGLLGWQAGSCLHLVQCVNIIYVMVGVFSGVRILSRFGISGRKLIASILFVTFFPTFTNLGAALNPDALVFMFMMLTLNGILDWYETRKRRKIIATAVLFGLGMATKYSMAMLLPTIILIYVLGGFYDVRMQKNTFARHGVIFAALGGGISLFWPLVNAIRFRMPLFYAEPTYEPWEVLKGVSLAQRLGPPSLRSLLHLHLTNDLKNECNLWSQTFKSAIVDENAINTSQVVTYLLTVMLLLLTILLCITMHAMLVRVLIGRREKLDTKLFIAVSYGSILLAYVSYCMRYPAVSVMNFRYIPVILVFPLLGMGLCGKGNPGGNLFDRITTHLSHWLILIISALSAFLFGFYAV